MNKRLAPPSMKPLLWSLWVERYKCMCSVSLVKRFTWAFRVEVLFAYPSPACSTYTTVQRINWAAVWHVSWVTMEREPGWIRPIVGHLHLSNTTSTPSTTLSPCSTALWRTWITWICLTLIRLWIGSKPTPPRRGLDAAQPSSKVRDAYSRH